MDDLLTAEDPLYRELYDVRREGEMLGNLVEKDVNPDMNAVRQRGGVQKGFLRELLGLPIYHRHELVAGKQGYSALSYEACETALRDHERFSSRIVHHPNPDNEKSMSILEMDGGLHRAFRRTLQPRFIEPQAVSWWRERWIDRLVAALIERLQGMEGAELNQDFCARIPIHTITLALGLAGDISLELRSAMFKAMGGGAKSPEDRQANAAKVQAILLDLFARRRAEPRDDLASFLVTSELRLPDGTVRMLTDREAMHLTRLVLVAGGGTTTRQMAILLWALLTHPEQLDDLRQDRSLMKQAIDEAVRWNTTAPLFNREVVEDTELCGVALPAGAALEVCLGSANRDPAWWDNPDAFDIHRPVKGHLGFGIGQHRCLGMNVAHSEMAIGMTALLDAFPNLRLDRDAPAPYMTGGFGIAQRFRFAGPAALIGMEGISIGIDVGGTFTDAVIIDGGRIWTAKSPTTANLADGVIAACELAAQRAGTTYSAILPRVSRFGLGTTAVTNAIASRRGARVGLLITRGFEETLHHARANLAVDDLRMHHGVELVASEDVAGIDERIDRNGVVLRPLDPEDVVEAAGKLIADGVEALAVSFLWSIVNPAHEIAATAAIRGKWPQMPLTSASALLPVQREYERTTLAVLNAYVSSICAGIDGLAQKLTADGLAAPLLLVHSGGGAISVEEARARPVWLAESGPAAGATAAAAVASRAGFEQCVSCDMGGTSFDVADIRDAEPSRITRGELMGIWTALPRVDVESIGAGGGSIAWIDARGMLRVGPHSAGSQPGPVCYGKGGTEPTVTDALVVLGYIDPDNFLGGDMVLDREAATAACAMVGARLALDAQAAAWGIREIALAEMTKATRTRLAMRGLDPRAHTLVSFGGCASLFTADIASALRAPRVIVPAAASVLSALGAATMGIRRERVRSLLKTMPVDPAEVSSIAQALIGEVTADLASDGVAQKDRAVSLEADLRFVRQNWDLTIPLAAIPFDEGFAATLLERFEREYAQRYGAGSITLGTPVELVVLRAVGTGPTTVIEPAATRANGGAQVVSATAARWVRSGADADARIEIGIFEDEAIAIDQSVAGPALIERWDTSIWVPGGYKAQRDSFGNLLLEVT